MQIEIIHEQREMRDEINDISGEILLLKAAFVELCTILEQRGMSERVLASTARDLLERFDAKPLSDNLPPT